MLHIHNGDATANTARQTSLPGEHFAWRESLITGPTPANLPPGEWRTMRARHLSNNYDVDVQQCVAELAAQDEKLAASISNHEEIVLWFEHDLFCQVHLVYLLDWFSTQNLLETKLSLICINEFPGKVDFRGLGELSAGELTSLFPARQEVTPAQMATANAAWQSYSADNPSAVADFLQTDTTALPSLDSALRAHLRRLPATSNGLGHTKRRALELIAGGSRDFSSLFERFSKSESIYGYGDAQFWLELRELCDGQAPLAIVEGFEIDVLQHQLLTPQLAKAAKFQITAAGEAVLADEADFITLNGIDEWLGGVHLHDPENLWRWDEAAQRLRFSSGPAVSEFGY